MLGFGYFLYLYMNSIGLIKDSYTSTCYTLVTARELNYFLLNICCESYRDLAPFVEERITLENNFPTYFEEQKSGKDLRWGDYKLGRLPAFLYEDLSSQSRSAERNASVIKSSFDPAFEYFRNARNSAISCSSTLTEVLTSTTLSNKHHTTN